ncbi:MAG: BamA/TamA family outer membrane protein [Saprospiraceae bacterium]|nr:BamA/TamA family outer membrane protein [Saprospiraceae bacterium]
MQIFGRVGRNASTAAGFQVQLFMKQNTCSLLLSVALMLLMPLFSLAQNEDTLQQKKGFIQKSSLIALPIVFYTPETRLGGGAAALYTFRFARESAESRPSQLQFGLAYTQEKQVLSYLPFDIYVQDEKWYISGELGYYRYVYRFFGLGNETPTESETFEATYPRLQLNAQYMVRPQLYLGTWYWMDDYRITKREEGGALSKAEIPGREGGFISGLGLIVNYDSRNHIFYPTTGQRLQFRTFFNRKQLGSRFNFDRYTMDWSYYFPVGKGVMATNVVGEFLSGEVPFQQLALIGGPRRMRGFFEGRFRDKSLWILQAEYRRVIKGIFGMAVFGGMGNVAPQASKLFREKVHLAYGLGLRIRLSKQDKINLRIDVGWNEEGNLSPYLTVAEAF